MYYGAVIACRGGVGPGRRHSKRQETGDFRCCRPRPAATAWPRSDLFRYNHKRIHCGYTDLLPYQLYQSYTFSDAACFPLNLSVLSIHHHGDVQCQHCGSEPNTTRY